MLLTVALLILALALALMPCISGTVLLHYENSAEHIMTEPIIRPLTDREVDICARIMSTSEPWITLGRGLEDAVRLLTNSDREKYVADVSGQVAGVLILVMRGAFVGYIQTVCVAPEFRGRGIGSRLIRHAEERIFRVSPNVFICVSSFNHSARRLYERLGYEMVGELRDYIVPGHSEILLRKTTGAMSTFKMTESNT
jgi:ribosomal protein S18 acetylase RimI-like enzyme